MFRNNSIFLLTVLATCIACGPKVAPIAPQVTVFENYSTGVPYRIPAIDQNRRGELVALADYRYCHSDIGFGPIDLHMAFSSDLGASWTAPQLMAAGDSTLTGNEFNYAFGDPSIVADRLSDEVLSMSCGGHIPWPYSRRDSLQSPVRHRSHDGGHTWEASEDVAEKIYSIFDGREAGPAQGIFFTSGRMCQSRQIKLGRYYRIYTAIPTRPGGIYVLYSDDFGEEWKVLGSIDAPPSARGDESKCEELPDGNVLLSMRRRGRGRGFNVFTYTDKAKAEGNWGNDVDAPVMEEVNACNGALLLVKARRASDGRKVCLMLQSITFQSSRTDVGIFYKELSGPDSYDESEDFAQGWEKGVMLSDHSSAYSDLVLLRDGTVGAFWEDELKDDGFDLIYRRLTVSDITGGAYR